MSEGKKVEFDVDEMFEKYEKKQKGSKLPAIITTMAIIGVVIFFYIYKDDVSQTINKFTMNENETVEANVDKSYLNGLRLSSIDRYKDAVNYFDNLNYDKLSADDQDIYMHTYIQAGELQKALKTDVTIDEKIVETLAKSNELEKLKGLKTSSKLIEFEVAVLNNEYEKIIGFKDEKTFEFNERRANAIANAYYELGDKEKAVNYIALMAHDGINTFNNKKSDMTDPINEVGNSNQSLSLNSPLVKIISLLIIVLLISSILFTLYKKRKVKSEDVSINTKDIHPINRSLQSRVERRKKKQRKKTKKAKKERPVIETVPVENKIEELEELKVVDKVEKVNIAEEDVEEKEVISIDEEVVDGTAREVTDIKKEVDVEDVKKPKKFKKQKPVKEEVVQAASSDEVEQIEDKKYSYHFED